MQSRQDRRYHRCLDVFARDTTSTRSERKLVGMEALTNTAVLRYFAAAVGVIACAFSLAPRTLSWRAQITERIVPLRPCRGACPIPRLPALEISGSQYVPLAWSRCRQDVRLSSRGLPSVPRQLPAHQPRSQGDPADTRRFAPRFATPAASPRAWSFRDGTGPGLFFDSNFLPVAISRLGEAEVFVTGYYEPIIDGSRTQNSLQCAGLSAGRQTFSCAHQSKLGRLAQQGVGLAQDRPPQSSCPITPRLKWRTARSKAAAWKSAGLRPDATFFSRRSRASARVQLDDGSTLRDSIIRANGYLYAGGPSILIERTHPERADVEAKIRE